MEYLEGEQREKEAKKKTWRNNAQNIFKFYE
jgi:hypothetical protein